MSETQPNEPLSEDEPEGDDQEDYGAKDGDDRDEPGEQDEIPVPEAD